MADFELSEKLKDHINYLSMPHYNEEEESRTYLSRENIFKALEQCRYKYFGDYEMSDEQRNAVTILQRAAIKLLGFMG